MWLALFLLTFLGFSDSGGSAPYTTKDITTVFEPAPAPAPEPACPPQTCSIPTFIVPQTFFGITQLSLNNPLASASFNIGYGRLWDTTCVWPNIETSNGTFTYTTGSNCDAFINWITGAGGIPVFVFGRTPTWAVDLTSINKITVTAGGTGYVSTPSCTISGGGTGATCTANIGGGAVTSVTITNPGTGYSSPSVSFGGPGTGATATVSLQVCTSSFSSSCSQAPKDLNSGNAILDGMVTSLVSHLASTHPGVHWVFECVNEADLTGEWTGAAGTSDRIADLVTFCTELRTKAHALDSSIIVLGPSGSSINASNLHLYSDGNNYAGKAGAAASLDAVNFHAYLQSCSTYCTTPELLETAWSQVNNVIKTGAPLAGKPVWITEANWGGTPPANNANLTAAQKRQYLARTIMYAFINNVTSLHWYAFDSHPDNLSIGFGSLCEGSPATSCTPNQAATTMNTMENWLVGATFLQTACAQDTNATWACTLQSSPASTGPAMLIFNGTTTHSFTVPSIYTHTLAWDGSSTSITSHTITAGPDVVLAIP